MKRNLLARASAACGCVLLAFASLCSHAADPARILRVAFVIAETGFDPQAASDLYSNYCNREMFDPLYRYDFLARPYKIIPNTAAGMPEISADGKTWVIKVKPVSSPGSASSIRGRGRTSSASSISIS